MRLCRTGDERGIEVASRVISFGAFCPLHDEQKDLERSKNHS
jgi:hypothetical protein